MAKHPARFANRTAMQFEHVTQHTLEVFDRIGARVKQAPIPPRELLFLAQDMLSHGHPDTLTATGLLKQNPHRDVIDHAMLLERCFHRLRQALRVEELDRKHLVRAYRREGYLLFESATRSRKLLVVFTTIFNNFFVSHLVLQALLKELDCHVLFLKETTLFSYQRGVSSYATSLPDLAAKIQTTARQLGADQIYVTGFSSGGYASLQTSLLLPCNGYLGFSHTTDLSPGSPLPRPWYLTDAVYAQLDPRWLWDLRDKLRDADPSVPRFLCYGDRSALDPLYAQHIAGLDTIRLVRLAKAGHNTILYLLGKNRLTEAFRRLVADR